MHSLSFQTGVAAQPPLAGREKYMASVELLRKQGEKTNRQMLKRIRGYFRVQNHDAMVEREGGALPSGTR